MTEESAHLGAPHRPADPQSSVLSERQQNHKRQRSQTIGTTFVSTAVVPAPTSPTDVLSSLISSLTLLSDSAREQIRSARELESALPDRSREPIFPAFASAPNLHNDFNFGIESQSAVLDYSDGDEAEPPIVGYSRSIPKDPKRTSGKEKWAIHGSTRDKFSNPVRSGSSQTHRRPPSGASSGIGVLSIERGLGASSSSLLVGSSSGTKSPLKMLFSSRPEDEPNLSTMGSAKETEAKSIKSFKTSRSKQSTRISQEQEKENYMPSPITAIDEQWSVPPEKSTPEHKTYSPLSPTNREDLGEHLIPSRRSSMRNSPSLRGSSKGRSPSAGRASSLHSKSFSTIGLEISTPALSEQPFEEDDSTLRRIRELQEAKEKRQSEWKKESRKSERRPRRPSRSRTKSAEADSPDSENPPVPEKDEKFLHISSRHLKIPEKLGLESVSSPVVHEIDLPSPSLNDAPSVPSPALSTPRKHKRSLSAGLRRSNSLRYRPVDDLRSVSEQVEAFLTAPRLTQRIRHPRTGRTIAFSEVGDPNGFAVICCVGMGLTRYVTSFYDDVARTQKLRLITPDRPGIGESSPFPENVCTPLAWVDDVTVICQTLNIDKFSLLAHSAGSIYALATALKMPDRVRGRIHLLAPWIPPSQFPNGSGTGDLKAANLPMAHKLLSILPAPLLKAANSRFLSATSASIEPRANKGWKKDRSIAATYDALLVEMTADLQPANLGDAASLRHSSLSQYASTPASTPPPYSYHNRIMSPPHSPSPSSLSRQISTSARRFRSPTPNDSSISLTPQAKQTLFNSELTHRTWALATSNANPAVDLLVCLERRRTVGFKYVDVTRGVVIHHGRNDTRVPLDNVQWLSETLKRCELRILNNEGHGLMASADVMSRVLGEIGREWEEWDVIAKDNEKIRKEQEAEREKIKEMERRRFIREGR